MLKVSIILLSVVCLAHMADMSEELKNRLRQIGSTVCSGSIAADKQNIIKKCEGEVPYMFKSSYKSCIRKAHGLVDDSQVTLPFICYSFIEGKEKVKECLEGKRRMGEKLGMDVDGMRTRTLTAFAVI